MGERVIKPLFNIHERYNKVNIINPYRFASGVDPDNPGKTDLVAYYGFENETGTTCFDSHTGGNDGTIVGATVNQTGKVGKCYDYDGVNDYVNSNINTNYTNFSFSAWIYMDSYGESNLGRIFDKGRDLLFWVRGSGINTLSFGQNFSSVNGRWETTVNTILTGQWYHVAVTYDNSSTDNNPVIYINGELQTITETSAPSGVITTNADNYLIGSRATVDRSFDGRIDEVMIYNRALSADNVTWLYNSGNGRSYSDL